MLYADPGSGAMIWQLLLAFFFGAAFFFNRFKTWIVTWWSGRRIENRPDTQTTTAATEAMSSSREGH